MPTAAKPAPKFRPRAHRFALESRQLFDGAALVEAAAVVSDVHHEGGDGHDAQPAAPEQAQPATAEPAAMPAAGAPAPQRNVYVIDQGVVNWQQLAAAVPAGGEVVLLTPQADGVAQLAAALQGQSGIASLSIFSHAAAGELRLGAGTVDAGSAARQAAQWQAIGAALGSDADILLYGCDLARDGTQLLQRLAELTGADVAASTDRTGAATAGGNWVLEASVGAVQTHALAVEDYDGLMAAPVVFPPPGLRFTVSEPSSLLSDTASSALLAGWTVQDDGGLLDVTVTVDNTDVGTLSSDTVSAVQTLSYRGTADQVNAWLGTVVKFTAKNTELGDLEGKTTVTVSVTDVETPSLKASASNTVTVIPVNDPVTLDAGAQWVNERGESVIGPALQPNDPEVLAGTQQAVQLVYSLQPDPAAQDAGLRHGYLTLFKAATNTTERLGLGSIFTQDDVERGYVRYVHTTTTGGQQNDPDHFWVRVNDGATPINASAVAKITLNITPLNQAPGVSGSGSVFEGQPANAVDAQARPLSEVGSFIQADGGGDDADATLTVQLTALPLDGKLYFQGRATVAGVLRTFDTPHLITQDEVNRGFAFDYTARAGLTYANDGDNDNHPTAPTPYAATDGFKVVVTDGGGGTSVAGASAETTITIDVRSVNDDPVWRGPAAPEATVTAAGESIGGTLQPYTVLITKALLYATDADSAKTNLTFVISAADTTYGSLRLDGARLRVGQAVTVAMIEADRVTYVQETLAPVSDPLQDVTALFKFQLVDNAVSLRWSGSGTSFERLGGDYASSEPGSALVQHELKLHLVTTQAGGGNGAGGGPSVPDIIYELTDKKNVDGSASEGGAIVLSGSPGPGVSGLKYSVSNVDAQQVVYTILSQDGGPSSGRWNGWLQRRSDSGSWVTLNAYDTFTQQEVNGGLIRYQHDGDSEDFESSVKLSASAGVVLQGQSSVDQWVTNLAFHITPTNDAPVVSGSSNTVIREGETAYITTSQLRISDPDDARSEDSVEADSNSFAYDNGAGGGPGLLFKVGTLPAGGRLEWRSSGSGATATWTTVNAGDPLAASLLTDAAASTGLRFVSDSSETRSFSFAVTAVDRHGLTSAAGQQATVRIDITNVNDAPQIAQTPIASNPPDNTANAPLHVTEGQGKVITAADLLRAADTDSDTAQVQYRITQAPTAGLLYYRADVRDAQGAVVGQASTLLGVGSSFTWNQVAQGRISYRHLGAEPAAASSPTSPDDRFKFTVSDGDQEENQREFWIYVDTPVNDAPVVVGPAEPVAVDSDTRAFNPVTGFDILDIDLAGFVSGQETDFMQVTVRLLDANGQPLSDAAYDAGITLAVNPSGVAGLVVETDHDADGKADYLVLRGQLADVKAKLATLAVHFSGDRNAVYHLQVIADDRLRDAGGALLDANTDMAGLQAGANGGRVNQAAPVTVPDTGFDPYTETTPDSSLAGNVATATVLLRVSSVNEPAVITAPPARTTYEDQPTFIGGGTDPFTVSDPESAAFDTPVTVTLTVTSGTLGIGGTGMQTSATASAAGSEVVTVAGDNSGTLVLTGRASDIQALLNDGTRGLTYRSATNANHDANTAAGDVTLTMSLSDSGSRFGNDVGSGSQANEPPSVTTAITVMPVNDAPTVVSSSSTTVYLSGTTNVSVFTVNDVDIAGDNGSGGSVSDGEQDYVQVTVRVTTAANGPLDESYYNGSNGRIDLGSTTALSSGATVDVTYGGAGAPLRLSGTRTQVNDFLAGLQVSFSGALANTNQAYRLQVIADDRLRDASGNLTTMANGGFNNNSSGGTSAALLTAIDPYTATSSQLGTLSANVGYVFRTVFATAVNEPASINAANRSFSEGDTVSLGTIEVTDLDADADTLTATVTLPAGFSFVLPVGGTGGSVGSPVTAGDGTLSITITGTTTQLTSRLSNIVVRLPDPDGAGAATATDWNGSFNVTVRVNDNGNNGSRPASLAGDTNNPTANPGDFTYQDTISNALVTTRTISVTVNPVNDAPVLTGGTQLTHAVTEVSGAAGTGVQAVRLLTGANIGDVDLASTGALNPATFGGGRLTVTLGAYPAGGGDELFVDGNLPAGMSVSASEDGIGKALTIEFSAGTTLAEVQALLGLLSWRSNSDTPTAVSATRAYSITVNDGNNAQSGGNAGGPAANSNVINGLINITAANDPPVAVDDTHAIAEDGAPIDGNVITGLPGSGVDSDPDNPVGDLRVSGVRTGTEAGTGSAGTVGGNLAGLHGTLVLEADGSYTYTLRSGDPVVDALRDGETLQEHFTYTLSDGAGGTDTAQLTITIQGRSEGVPAVVPQDVNGAGAAGHADVFEAGLADAADTREVTTGTVALSAQDGLGGFSVGGRSFTLAELRTFSGASPSDAIVTPRGTLVLTGFTPTAAVTLNGAEVVTAATVSYRYTLSAAQAHGAGAGEMLDDIALLVSDRDGDATPGTLVVRIVDDAPTATDDAAGITEDASPATVQGDVFANDRLGADATNTPVTGLRFGATPGTPGQPLATAYGSITLGSDGRWTYKLDNTNPVVNALKAGDTLTETVAYRIADADGDTAEATLTITIYGRTDGAPGVTPVDGNGAATGQAEVHERGLVAPPDGSATTGGTIRVSAPDGLRSLTVGGMVLGPAQLVALSPSNATVIDTGEGILRLTGFAPDGSPGGGTLAYTYTLKAALEQPLQGATTDGIALLVTDAGGDTAAGTLVVRIVDDAPTAVDDAAGITEDASPATVQGDVFANDRLGADATNTPVTGLRFGATPGTPGQPLATAYGSITLGSDGRWTYTLDNANPVVNALKAGDTLTETVAYRIADADGDTAEATLTITIYGRTDGAPGVTPVDGNGAAIGQAEVHERGLVDAADPRERTTGSVSVSAKDGLRVVQVGGVTLDLAALQALSPGRSAVIDTGAGVLRLTGFSVAATVGGVPTAGSLAYEYTLKAALRQPGAGDGTDGIALAVTDVAGIESRGTLSVRIVDDAPAAADDAAEIAEDGAPASVSGRLLSNDTVGADANAAPVSAVSFNGTAGTPGTAIATAYGSIVVGADGRWTYTLDNANPAVQRLTANETLTERLAYRITDADGDTADATLVITIRGTNDVPALVIDDGNGGATGQASVSERGLADADGSQATQGRFVVTAPDGLQGVSVGGTFVSAARLAALAGTPLDIVTGRGVITLTGFDAASGALSWRYVLSAPQAHPAGDEITDDIALSVLDRDGDRVNGTLRVLVLDDAPLARDDAAQLSVALPRATASGNLLGGTGRGDGDVADRSGADVPVAVSSITFEGRSGSVGAGALRGQYGTLRVEADGRYVYAVDDAHPAVAALGDGKTLTERFTYTLRDADGSTSTATLVVTIRGSSAFVKAGDQIFPVAWEPQQRDIRQSMDLGLFVQHAVRDSAQQSLALATGNAGMFGLHLGDELLSETLLVNLAMDHAQHVSRDGVGLSLRLEREARQLLAQRLEQSELTEPALPPPPGVPTGPGNAYVAPTADEVAASRPVGERIVVPRPETAVGAGASGKAAVPAAPARAAAPGFSRLLAAQADAHAGTAGFARGPSTAISATRIKVPQAHG